MNTKKLTNQMFSTLTLAMAATVVTTMTLSLANMASADGGATPDPARKAAFQSCAAKNDVNLPIQGGMSSVTRQAMGECMREAGFSFEGHHHHHPHWKAIKACVTAQGVQLPAFTPGEKPTLTAQQQSAIQTCRAQLKAKHQASSTSTTSQ